MRGSKWLVIFWSKAAVDAAGFALPSLQASLLDEIGEIVSKACHWLLHSIPRGSDDDACYL